MTAAIAAGCLTVAAAVVIPMTATASPTVPSTTTPIKHVVVLFDENESYDHYFGTYPTAANTDGVKFTAAANTPANDNLVSANLLTTNPNSVAPFRLASNQALTCSQNHNYAPEQKAVDGGAMDKFVENTSSSATCNSSNSTEFGTSGLGMGYYDGNTVTGLWNLAQNYSMSDNSWDAGFGPSTPGALNLVSGNTANATAYTEASGVDNPTVSTSTTALASATAGVGTVIADPDPVYDDCADNDHTSTSDLVGRNSQNIGDLLNAQNVTWGWFQGGFTPSTAWDGTAGHYAKCDTTHVSIGGVNTSASTGAAAAGNQSKDYSPHHNPFAYFKSTSNPHHLAPSSDAMIGKTDQANHQYDLSAFTTALQQGNLPAVSYLKAAEYQDAHPGYSDPIDEQNFVTREVDAIEASPEWSSTMIVINYDDSDGWYDHVAPTILNGSNDATNDQAICTSAAAVLATAPLGGYQDRCGPSQRIPMLVISPFARQNYIDHTHVDQTSVLKFIEDNWSTGRIGDSSLDAKAGSITGMLDFQHPQQRSVLLKSDGEVSAINPVSVPPAGGFSSTTTQSVRNTTFGTAATDVVKVASQGSVVGGVVTVKVDGRSVGSTTLTGTTGAVSLPASLSVGKHTVEASFAGSADVKASTSSKTSITVSKVGTRSAVKLGSTTAKVKHTHVKVTLTVAQVSGSTYPTGWATITVDDRAVLKVKLTAASHGKARVSLPVIRSVGTHHIRVTYPGSSDFLSSTSAPVTLKVKR